jgi:hypothetical protein
MKIPFTNWFLKKVNGEWSLVRWWPEAHYFHNRWTLQSPFKWKP